MLPSTGPTTVPLIAPLERGMLARIAGPGVEVSPDIRAILLGQLLVSPRTTVIATLVGLAVALISAVVDGHAAFKALVVLNVAVGCARYAAIRQIARTQEAGLKASVGSALALMLLWCALQGAVAFVAMQTGSRTLQNLAGVLVYALVGPICARNYPAPRLAQAMVGLCVLPFVAGACISGETWALILVPLTAIYLVITHRITSDLRDMAVKLLSSELESGRRARVDPLTGLWNRLGYDETLAHVTELQLTLFCLDLDGFKQVNDTFGHPGGDKLLQGVARRLEASVRLGDTIYRTGGDEFVIMAKGIRPEQAAPFATRIIETVTLEPYALEHGRTARIGLSVGYACFPEDGIDLYMLHRRADAALYASKAAGKRVHRRYQPAFG